MAWIIPVIAIAAGAGASLLKSRAAGKSVQEQERLYNEWLKNRQNGVNDLLEKVTGGGYNPFGPQVSTQQGTSNSTTKSNSTTNYTQQPFVTPDYKGMEGMFKGLVEGRLARPTALPPGYIQGQVRNINQSYAGADQAVRNLAARRGLSADATLGAAAPSQAARAGKIADFLGTVPLTERDMRTQDIQLAEALTQMFGLGTKGTSTTSGVSNTSGSSSSMLTSPPNLGALAALLLPPGPNAPSGTGQSAFGQAGGDLASILAWFWASGAFGGPKPAAGSTPGVP